MLTPLLIASCKAFLFLSLTFFSELVNVPSKSNAIALNILFPSSSPGMFFSLFYRDYFLITLYAISATPFVFLLTVLFFLLPFILYRQTRALSYISFFPESKENLNLLFFYILLSNFFLHFPLHFASITEQNFIAYSESVELHRS